MFIKIGQEEKILSIIDDDSCDEKNIKKQYEKNKKENGNKKESIIESEMDKQ
mgnify:CR=1 FL=1